MLAKVYFIFVFYKTKWNCCYIIVNLHFKKLKKNKILKIEFIDNNGQLAPRVIRTECKQEEN